jgi:acetyl-CoA carboxylase carboxyl transferase subunit beta
MAWHFSRKKKDMPDGLWMRCDECSQTVYKEDVEQSLHVCPQCNFHFRLDSKKRITLTLDPNSFDEQFADITPTDPLDFVDREPYKHRLERYTAATGLKDAMVIGTGTVKGWHVAFGVLDTTFMMGSLGSVMGEKIYRLAEIAVKERIPMVLVCGSGGARMQEGVVSLMQMIKTSAAIALCQESGVGTIAVLTNPTTGGTTASFATETDVIIAEPGALIGFTGPRVIEETIKQKLPDGFQRSEFMMEHGLVDMVVPRSELRDTLAQLAEYLGAEGAPAREIRPEDEDTQQVSGGEIITDDQQPQGAGTPQGDEAQGPEPPTNQAILK